MNTFVQTIRTLRVISDLEHQGCCVLDAHILPSPAVRISPPPVGVIRSYGHLALPEGTWAAPVECTAIIKGVRITWMDRGVRHV